MDCGQAKVLRVRFDDGEIFDSYKFPKIKLKTPPSLPPPSPT